VKKSKQEYNYEQEQGNEYSI